LAQAGRPELMVNAQNLVLIGIARVYKDRSTAGGSPEAPLSTTVMQG
jgi:hypothetical protein